MIAQHLYMMAFEHHRAGRLKEAEAVYRAALRHDPRLSGALCNLGILSHRAGDEETALDYLRRALDSDPHSALALSNMGVVLKSLGRLEESLSAQSQAEKMNPDSPAIHHNLGTIYRALSRLEEAESSFKRALALKPDFVDAEFGLANLKLAQGDFESGFELYECRWNLEEGRKARRSFNAPRWNGESLDGKTLLIHAEQGFGDTIQFIRLATLLREGKVIFEGQKALLPLLRGVGGIDELVAAGEPLPHFDYHLPLLSLPNVMKLKVEEIPAEIPYVRSEPGLVAAWGRRLGPRRGRRVGLVWRGSPGHVNDSERSMDPSLLSPLLDLEETELIGLQKDPKPGDLEQLPGVRNLGPELADFGDTAAVLAHMDITLSVCTSVLHLAGALGRKSIGLLPYVADWRWLLSREDSPWYPSIQLIRQRRPGDWPEVVDRAVETIREHQPQQF
ncbi:MAG: tetratricopeptide repeat protein [Holophagaceae bacterium]|nr:tetratricopeptide repeat protein [Holophagaceae bacterium]